MVVQRLIEVASPKKIILFGSYITGDATRDSDLDLLLVTSHEVETPRRESVRLRNSLSDTNMPMASSLCLLADLKRSARSPASNIQRRTATARWCTRAKV
jgi:predicted nucleotidyltransferase